MTSPLKLLFEAINQARSEHDLRSQVVPKIGEYFAAKRWRIFFFEQLPLADSNQHKRRSLINRANGILVNQLVLWCNVGNVTAMDYAAPKRAIASLEFLRYPSSVNLR